MPTLTDPLGHRIQLDKAPRRIVCLVPSITELLAEYGLEAEVVGITKFCTHPESWFRQKTRVGGTKTIDVARIRALRPDLIIANQEENDRAAVEELQRAFPVYVSRVATLEDAETLYRDISVLTHKTEVAAQFLERIRITREKTKARYAGSRAAYLIWQNPHMVAGGDTYIHAVMDWLGLQNVFADTKRYPTISLSDCRDRGAGLILLSSEPFPFAQKHLDALRAEWSDLTFALVDGRLFSWYGPAFCELDKLPTRFDQPEIKSS